MPTPEEKEELLRWGASFNHKIDGVMEVVKPATYRRWLRMKKRKINFKPSGRPRIPECIRKIVRRMAVENVLWGYERIVGELKKIGRTVSRKRRIWGSSVSKRGRMFQSHEKQQENAFFIWILLESREENAENSFSWIGMRAPCGVKWEISENRTIN